MKIGVIRVFTTDDQQVLNEHGNVIERVTGLKCVNRCIQDQPKGIYNDETEKEAVPKIVQLAKQMSEKDQVSGIVISCAADPGLEEAREAVTIPVLGAGSCAALVARAISNKVGILSITNGAPKAMKEVLGERIVGWAKPEGISNTSDLLKPGAIQKAKEATVRLLESGAEVIVFGCTGFVTIGLSQVLRKDLRIKVVDPVEAEGQLLKLFLEGR